MKLSPYNPSAPLNSLLTTNVSLAGRSAASLRTMIVEVVHDAQQQIHHLTIERNLLQRDNQALRQRNADLLTTKPHHD